VNADRRGMFRGPIGSGNCLRWVLVLLVLVAAPADATRFRTVPLGERVRLAERIVVGRVSSVRVGAHPRYPRVVVTHVTLRVRETWKGETTETLSFMQFGDASDEPRPAPQGGELYSPRIPGMPSYRVGEEVLLFLHRPSEAGLTSPVGGPAGKVPIRRDATTTTPGVPEATLAGGSEAAGGRTVSLELARSRVRASLREKGRTP
jgi:hypothetical protein